MEQNFQTSFIPKKPMVRDTVKYSRPIGFFTVITFFVLLTVVLVAGGFYFYKGVLQKNIQSMSNDLALAKNRFEPARIAELQVLDKRLDAASEILSKHVVITPIFQALQAITMKTVQYTSFNYTFGGKPGDKINVHMSGVASGYSYLALQSDLYAKNKNFFNPVFSNLTLNEEGKVVFDLEFSVDPSFIDYKIRLQTEAEGQNSNNPLDTSGIINPNIEDVIPDTTSIQNSNSNQNPAAPQIISPTSGAQAPNNSTAQEPTSNPNNNPVIQDFAPNRD